MWNFVAAAVGIGGALLSGKEARKNAKEQEAYNRKVEELNKAYRLEVMAYQNEQYEADTDYYGRLVGYQKDEFDKFKTYATAQSEAVEENFVDQLAAQMQRVAEIDIAAYLDIEDVNFQELGAAGSLQLAQAEAGVAGNTANILQGEVQRQAGTGRIAADLQYKANRRQAISETKSLKARRDQALSGIRVPTFQPMQPPQPPAPVSPVTPAAPVSRPSTGSVLLNAANAGLRGYSSFP